MPTISGQALGRKKPLAVEDAVPTPTTARSRPVTC